MQAPSPGSTETDAGAETERIRLVYEDQQRVARVRRKGLGYLLVAGIIMSGVVVVAVMTNRLFFWLFALRCGMGAWGALLASIPRLILEQFPAADD